MKAIITISANASQNEQSCIGPNELTRQLVSQPCIEKLISDMLKGGNPLTVGVGIVIEVIRKNNSDYDPEVGAEATAVPSSRDPIYLGTLLRLFAQHVPDFMDLILSPNHTVGGGESIKRKELGAAFGAKIEPLGFDRFKTCELMAELLHCSNMGLLNEIGSEEFVKARDAERERLKAEGKLNVSPNDQSMLSTDDLTMKSSTTTRLGSPDGSRKLEVANASDDDGFEEVTHSGDLGDDPKDDFDEKLEPEEDILTPTKPPTTTPLSFLEKDEDEFVDEPLSSPRLNNVEPDESRHLEEPDMAVQPLSPSKELAQQVDSLEFKDEDTAMTTPPSVHAELNQSSEPVTGESGSDLPESTEQAATSLEQENQKLVESAPTTVESLQPLDIVPHPEDKPAPLFAKKTEASQEQAEPTVESSKDTDASGGQDTAMGEAGDSSASILMGGTEDLHQESSIEESTTPVVGDFLKMQFVEHKVVPTILVSSKWHGLT